MLKALTIERGALRKAVILAISELGRDAYATKIDQQLSKEFKRTTMLQQVHTALTRLKKQNLVEKIGEDAGEHRRRPRTIYGLTESGQAVLEELRSSRTEPIGVALQATP